MVRTRNTVRRTAILAAGVLAVVPLSLGAAARACTPLPRSFGLIPKAASGAALAKAVGEGVAPRSPVEVRWDDVKGDLIGSAVADEKGQFSAMVAIPPAPRGAHIVLFRAQAVGTSELTTVGRLPFAVMSPGELQSTASETGRSRVRIASAQPKSGGRAPTNGALAMVVGIVALSVGGTVALVGRRRAAADTTA